MKKRFLFLMICTILAAGGLSAQQMNLDAVLSRAAEGIEEVLPQGTKAAILNFVSSSESFSDFVIEELTGKLVTGRKVTIVDRRSLALIREEMSLQLSGDVSDESAQAIGKMLGAQSIVSGSLTDMGTFYRFRVRVINVETAAIQTQVSLDMQNDARVAFLLGATATQTAPVTGQTPSVDEETPLSEGIMVPGNSLAEKLAWLDRTADSHNTYILVAFANENIAPYTFEYRGAINITVALRGDGQNRTIRLKSNGKMFTVKPDVTFILERDITLQGHNGNNAAMIHLEGGTFKMRTGAAITGNVIASRNFYGGAVGINSGTFEMTGGTISGNTVDERAGGVGLLGGTFTMTGGTISGNTAKARGGGVSVGGGGTFTMTGGIIAGNTAREYGGGVYHDYGSFSKSGGVITGYNSDQNNGNVIRDEAGNLLARRGHAVFVRENLRKETSAGQGDNLSNRDSGRWD